tara:strand:+ start:44 stop:331 length:288 start_codon:yes stop_codon:yes gene_type:complete
MGPFISYVTIILFDSMSPSWKMNKLSLYAFFDSIKPRPNIIKNTNKEIAKKKAIVLKKKFKKRFILIHNNIRAYFPRFKKKLIYHLKSFYKSLNE